jgi:hypothetical protein
MRGTGCAVVGLAAMSPPSDSEAASNDADRLTPASRRPAKTNVPKRRSAPYRHRKSSFRPKGGSMPRSALPPDTE